jgi:hypothetical protein
MLWGSMFQPVIRRCRFSLFSDDNAIETFAISSASGRTDK